MIVESVASRRRRRVSVVASVTLLASPLTPAAYAQFGSGAPTIAFASLTGVRPNVFIADADGSHERLVAPGCIGKCEDAWWPDPSWQPLR